MNQIEIPDFENDPNYIRDMDAYWEEEGRRQRRAVRLGLLKSLLQRCKKKHDRMGRMTRWAHVLKLWICVAAHRCPCPRLAERHKHVEAALISYSTTSRGWESESLIVGGGWRNWWYELENDGDMT